MKSLVAVVFLVTVSLAAPGASFNTNPSADAFVTTGSGGSLSANNYGGGGAIALAAPGLPQGELQSVMQFNLGGAFSSFNSTFGVGQWSIESVSLQLNAAAANNALFNAPAAGLFNISWMQNDSWVEGTGTPAAPGASGITFNSLQSTFIGPGDEGLGTFGFNGATTGAFNYSLTLSPGFTGDLLAGENLSLRLFAADGSVSGVFNSRSFGTAGNRPLLTVVAVPEPGTLTMAGIGGLLLAGRRWRRLGK